MRFYNTIARQVEEFSSIKPNLVKMYTCGPTVYNFAHIGNFRAYIFEDILRRALQFCSYKVMQVMNLTDVDDKTIRNSISSGMSLNDYTQQYKDAFFEDIKELRIEPAEVYPWATEHIPEMIELIEKLLDKGFAYIGDDKCVYYSIAKFAKYGQLANINLEEQRVGERVKKDEYAKNSVADFALWKAWTADDGDIFWDSPWGKGRPGWHIECSAMSMKYLGKHFDIHTGGVDNIFPHHEDEIAQSEAANGQKYVNFWLHCSHLMVEGQKMSKSDGNFFTLRDLLKKGYNGREIRWVLINCHYRQQINFSLDALTSARTTLTRLDDLIIKLKETIALDIQNDHNIDKITNSMLVKFKNGLSDDLNISIGMSSIFEYVKELNKLIANSSLSSNCAKDALDALRKVDSVIACLDIDKEEAIPEEINALLESRMLARKAKDFAESDRIRNEIRELGYALEDIKGTQRIKKL